LNATHRSRAFTRPAGVTVPAVVIGLLVIALSVWLAHREGFLWAEKKTEEEDKNPVLELATADVATVRLAVLSRLLPVTGSLSPLAQTTVKAQAPGEVLEVTVREGQSVGAGEVLVRIDTRNLEAELQARQADLERARADLSLAQLNLDKSEAVLKKGFISQNAHDATVAAHQAAVAGVKAAEAQLALAKNALDYATVRAPFTGTISARLVQPGEKVEIGSSLVGLVDLAHLELQAPAPADDVPAVRVGQIAKFRVNGFGDRLFEGHVERINPMTDTGSRSVMLYLSVPNPEGVLKGGMFAQGDLILDETAPVAAIPLTAVRSQAGIPYVLTIDDSKLASRPVQLGLRSEEQNLVEVTGGLAAGERVVSARIETLKEGTPVVVSTPAASTAASAPESGASGGG
jgi:RND family efflux transporter MFP subunit